MGIEGTRRWEEEKERERRQNEGTRRRWRGGGAGIRSREKGWRRWWTNKKGGKRLEGVNEGKRRRRWRVRG